jgi:hypothetical protein
MAILLKKLTFGLEASSLKYATTDPDRSTGGKARSSLCRNKRLDEERRWKRRETPPGNARDVGDAPTGRRGIWRSAGTKHAA